MSGPATRDRPGWPRQGRVPSAPVPERIPFFDLASLGGHDTLRGFEEFRVRDRKAVPANLEPSLFFGFLENTFGR